MRAKTLAIAAVTLAMSAFGVSRANAQIPIVVCHDGSQVAATNPQTCRFRGGIDELATRRLQSMQNNNGRYDNGRYNNGRYDNGQYDNGRYNNGRYNNGQYDNGRYDNGRYNQSQSQNRDDDRNRIDRDARSGVNQRGTYDPRQNGRSNDDARDKHDVRRGVPQRQH